MAREHENISSASVTATGTVIATGPGRVRSLDMRCTGIAGSLVLKDGGSGGTTILTLYTSASVDKAFYDIPAGGIQFNTDLYATLTNVDGLTVFYAPRR